MRTSLANRIYSTSWNRNWPILIVILSIPITFCIGLWLGVLAKDIFATAVLCATLVAVIWYSAETRTLRLAQSAIAQLSNHPWLSVEFKESFQLNVKETHGSKEKFIFIIHNSGQTPAHEVTVSGRWVVRADHGAIQPEATISGRLGVIAPNRYIPFEIIIQWELVREISIFFEVSYITGQGGGGQLSYRYEFENHGKLLMCNESLQYWLSDGFIRLIKSNRE